MTSDDQGRMLRVVGSPGEGSNPFTRLLAEALTRTEAVALARYSKRVVASTWPDVWHLNWPEAAYRSASAPVAMLKAAKLVGQLRLARARGVRVAWTVHNLTPHEVRFPAVERWFWPRFRRQVDLFVHLSHAGRAWYLDLFPEVASRQHVALWHPVYPVPQASCAPRREARRALGIGEEVRLVGVVGRLEPYKRIPSAIATFRGTPGDDLRLVVAGSAGSPVEERRIRLAAEGDERVQLKIGLLAEERFHWLIRACDLVLLPYDRFLNSGALLLALSLRRPVLVADTPVTREIADRVGHGWVHRFAPPLSPGDIGAALRDISTRPSGPDVDGMDWEHFARDLVQAYRVSVGR